MLNLLVQQLAPACNTDDKLIRQCGPCATQMLVGEGKSAKYVKGASGQCYLSSNSPGHANKFSMCDAACYAECKEMYLGNKGIEKIRGFEDFVNLEFLCLNSNKLKKINNLDTCTRMKILNVQVQCALVGAGKQSCSSSRRMASRVLPVANVCQRFHQRCLQDNQVCTLKGSLLCFTFLEQLDLSNNQLRDLAKLTPVLQKFQFLTHLNLKVGALELWAEGSRLPSLK